MKRTILCFALICILLCACHSELPIGTTPESATDVPLEYFRELQLNGVYYSPEIRAFGGQIEKPQPSLPLEEIGDGRYLFRNVSYRCYSQWMWFFNPNSTTSSWYMDAGNFHAIAQTKDGLYICAMDADAELNILLVCKAGEVAGAACYVREDSSILDIDSYELTDFDIKVDGIDSEDTTFVSTLWDSHISKRDDWESMPTYLDEQPKKTPHVMELISKEHPMLTYRLRYMNSDAPEMENKVGLDNIYEAHPIVIPLPLSTAPENPSDAPGVTTTECPADPLFSIMGIELEYTTDVLKVHHVPEVPAVGGQIQKPQPGLPIEEIGDARHVFRNVSYRCYSQQMWFSNFNNTTSCWYMDLGSFHAIAQTKDGLYICAMEADADLNILLVCKAGQAAEAACYVREDSSILNIDSYELTDFNIKVDGIDSNNTALVSALWDSHISKKDDWDFMPMYLDEQPKKMPHVVDMTSKEYPMLTYRLRYTNSDEPKMDNKVGLDNIYETSPIVIPLPQQ